MWLSSFFPLSPLAPLSQVTTNLVCLADFGFCLTFGFRLNSRASYVKFAQRADEVSEKCNLRGLFDFKKKGSPIPIDEVEPAKDIVKRFSTGAMSYGSISIEAHETIAIAMNRIGAKSNTGTSSELVFHFPLHFPE